MLRRWDLASDKLVSLRTSQPLRGEIVHWALQQKLIASLTLDKATAYLWDSETGVPLGAITVACDKIVYISPEGHYHCPPGVEKELVYVAMTNSGEQITLTPDEFSKKYGWKNDPTKVSLKAEGRKPKAGEETRQ